MATPTMLWHVSSSATPQALTSTAGDDYKIRAPNTSLQGNCNVLFLAYLTGLTPTITDTNGNTWPAATKTVDAGAGGMIMSVFVLPNIKAGLNVLNIHFGTSFRPFAYRFMEWNNVDQVSPTSGSSGTANVTAPNLTCGSFTPGNGNQVIAYFSPAAQSGTGHVTSWVAGGSFTLLDADIAWNTNNQGFPQASEQFLSNTASAINPGITATSDTQGYNCVAVALNASTGSAGSPRPAGIYVNKIIHQSWAVGPPLTFPLQFPTTGNLRVLDIGDQLVNVVNSITDSEGNTDWTQKTLDTTTPQFWYSANANKSANPNLVITLHLNSSPSPAKASARFFDISGAAATPFDVTAGATSVDRSGQSTFSGPTIPPSTANGLVIAKIDIGNGPGLAVTSPSGVIWDLCTYAGEVDDEYMENADGLAHFYNPDTSSESWAWTITNNASNPNVSGQAIAFKAATVVGGLPPARYLGWY